MVPAVLVRLLLPMAGVFAVYLFMRGHNEPGGGFVAGLVMAIAFIAAVHGRRHALGRGAHAPAAAALDRRRPAARAGHRAGRAGARLSVPDHAHRASAPGRWSARCTCPARCSSTSACSRWWSASTLLILTALAHQSMRARRQPAPAEPSTAREPADGSRDRARDRRAGRRRRLAGAAAAHLPGDHGPVAAVLRGQPVHLQHGQPVDRQASRSSGPACRPTWSTTPTRCRRRWC